MKTIDTLVHDVERLFVEGHQCDPESVERLGKAVGDMVSRRLADNLVRQDRNGLRMSNVGKPARQLWYDTHGDHAPEELNASTLLKFLYGDILELLLLFLAREAGHTVESEQAEVEVNGVLGHIDAVIDGVVVDVKSANSNSYRMFEGKLDSADPFSYIEQLSGYSKGLGDIPGAFWVVNKELGHHKLIPVSVEDMQVINIDERIDYLKTVLSNPDEIPERCYDPVPEGKSGNMVLPVGCSYCSHKAHCWADANGGIGLRTFIYSKGPVHFTTVAKEPNGPPEVTF